jgi:site-specific DNA-methyltransferase (adenine-specific)
VVAISPFFILMNEILNIEERNELERCEVVIKQGLQTFVEVGQALMLIRDKRLYRAEYGTFENYCNEKWNLSRNFVNKTIAASNVVSNIEMGTMVPKTERQARPLTKVEPELQTEVWQETVNRHGDNITAKKVEEVVKDFKPLNDELKQAKKEPMFAAQSEAEILAKAKEITNKKREEKRSVIEQELQRRKEQSAKYLEGQNIDNVVLGDATKISFPKNASVLITDPPYGMQFISNRRTVQPKDEGIVNDEDLSQAMIVLHNVLRNVYDSLKQDAHVFIFTGWRYELDFRFAISTFFNIKGSLIWVKNNHGSGDLQGSFAPKHERIIHAVKGKPKLIKRIPDVLYGSDFRTNHPTRKPVDLIKQLIEVTTVEGELVIDTFGGEGSTAIAAKEMNRKYFISEIDKYNYSQIINHLQND